VDITENKRIKDELADSRLLAESIVDSVREPLIILDEDLKIMSANRAFYATFNTRSEKTEKRSVYDLGDRQWDIPALRTLLEKIGSENDCFDDYMVEHDFPGIGPRKIILNARSIKPVTDKGKLILLAMEDVTGKK